MWPVCVCVQGFMWLYLFSLQALPQDPRNSQSPSYTCMGRVCTFGCARECGIQNFAFFTGAHSRHCVGRKNAPLSRPPQSPARSCARCQAHGAEAQPCGLAQPIAIMSGHNPGRSTCARSRVMCFRTPRIPLTHLPCYSHRCSPRVASHEFRRSGYVT